MKKIYVTFGWGHTHSINGHSLDHDTIAEILIEEWEDARSVARLFFGDKYSRVYASLDDVGLTYYKNGVVEIC